MYEEKKKNACHKAQVYKLCNCKVVASRVVVSTPSSLFQSSMQQNIGRADFFLWFRDFKNSTNGAGYDFQKH